jgi:hypothetical protein
MKKLGVLFLVLSAACSNDSADAPEQAGFQRTATVKIQCEFALDHESRRIEKTTATFSAHAGIENMLVKEVKDSAGGTWQLVATEQFGLLRLELTAIGIKGFDEIELEGPVGSDGFSTKVSLGLEASLSCSKG